MNSWNHAQSAAKKWGGRPEDFIEIEEFIDSSKVEGYSHDQAREAALEDPSHFMWVRWILGLVQTTALRFLGMSGLCLSQRVDVDAEGWRYVMDVDASDSGDGITFEIGTKPLRIRAVVMRHGQRVTSKWRRTKDAALRNLVVELTRKVAEHENSTYNWESGEVFSPAPDEVRLDIADGMEAIAMVEFENSGSNAELFHLNGKEHIINKLDRLFRGANTLRWVQRRENAR